MRKTNNLIKIISKHKILTFIIITLLICLFFLLPKTDGMYQNGITDTYYRVYTKEKGWLKWAKNGMIAGDKKQEIYGIEIKKKNISIPIIYTYTDKINKNDEKTNKKIYGVRLLASYGLIEKNTVCYRTYNKKNGWLDWNCDMEFSGNINEPITAFEMKVIPKNVAKQDYLKDYNKNKYSSIGFDEVR